MSRLDQARPCRPNSLTSQARFGRILPVMSRTPSRPAAGTDGSCIKLAAARPTVVALFLRAALLGTVGGFLFAYGGDLPEISALDDYQPNTITRLLARDGHVIGEFATERRVVIGYDDIAPSLRQAIIATEDADFEQHFGLSISRIIVTAVRTSSRASAPAPAPSLSSSPGTSSCNEYMSGGVYDDRARGSSARSARQSWSRSSSRSGTPSAKSSRSTPTRSTSDMARTASRPARGCTSTSRRRTSRSTKRRPSRRSSRRRRDSARSSIPSAPSPGATATCCRGWSRRASSPAGRPRSGGERPLVLRGQPSPERVDRRRTSRRRSARRSSSDFGADALYQAGLQVQTTLDVELQDAANARVDRGLRRVDKRRSVYRKPARNVVRRGDARDLHHRPLVPARSPRATSCPAVVDGAAAGRRGTGAHPDRRRRTRPSRERLRLDAEDGRRAPLRVGDVIEVESACSTRGSTASSPLEQAPVVEGALIAIDNRTGQIRAMVGGFSFARSKFNRATQARRQLGSLFKPVVYTAAIDRGFTADIDLHRRAGVVRGWAEPAAVSAAQLRPQVRRPGDAAARARAVAQHPGRQGDASSRAGAGRGLRASASASRGSIRPTSRWRSAPPKSTLLEMTSAYSAFPNQGVRMTPYAVAIDHRSRRQRRSRRTGPSRTRRSAPTRPS